MQTPVRRALLSVSDKTGIVDLARRLSARGVALLSTGGTAQLLKDAGLAVTDVAEHTGFPEIMDGRVKTLHPKIHGGLLGRRDLDAAVMDAHGIAPIDLLVVNLYPFEQTVARPGCTRAEGIENIDIGGPAMLRAAAKNSAWVTVLTDPADYEAVLAEIDEGGVKATTRQRLAAKAYARTAAYDAAVTAWLTATPPSPFPATLGWQLTKAQDLRYGENPHQHAAFYVQKAPPPGSLATAQQLQGKEMSFNNLNDADAALACVKAFPEAAACVIVKHANPCGVALGQTPREAYERAHATDPTSAFGGIIAFNRLLDADTARAIVERQFVEVILAPEISPEALEVTRAKTNVRVVATGWWRGHAGRDALATPAESNPDSWDVKRLSGGFLVQTADDRVLAPADLKPASRRAPTQAEQQDLLFAWRVAKFVKSNAIVYARDGRTLGVGAGQMSRVDSARIAALKAEEAGLSLAGAVMASDAFFPFRDGIDAAAGRGIAAVIQPGGSMRDGEVVAAADEAGMAMVFTGVRHFRH